MNTGMQIVSGQVFGSFTVVKEDRKRGKYRYVLCKCKCGKEVSISISNLKIQKSCGCSRKGINRIHGMHGIPEYKSWKNIKQRCHDPHCPDYKNYGGRGIEVCIEWQDSFQAFYDHIGPKPGSEYSVDRIDNNGNYEPGNVRWATQSDQNRNTRNNRILTFNGRSQSVVEWSEELGISHGTICNRLDRLHWSIERALLTKVQLHKKQFTSDRA